MAAAAREQLVVGALFGDGAVLQEDDLAGAAHGVHPVRDHHDGPARHEAFDAFLDGRLVDRVQGRRHLVGTGSLRCSPYLRVGGVGAAEADVLLDGAVEEVDALKDDGELRHEDVRDDRAYVDAAHPDGSRLDVVEAGEELEQGDLPASEGPTTARRCPWGTVSVSPSSTVRSPCRKQTPSNSGAWPTGSTESGGDGQRLGAQQGVQLGQHGAGSAEPAADVGEGEERVGAADGEHQDRQDLGDADAAAERQVGAQGEQAR
ncbi:hypothetical protein [Streptomyces cremeus]|uniref:hypothetical protein n=1 Tax=Streptomyces cremeus TaxID=66881 RepID=UPI0031E6B6B6